MGSIPRNKLFLAATVAFQLLAFALSERVLVLVSNRSIKASHSELLQDITSAGAELEFQEISENIILSSWGRWLYDGVVVLAGSSEEFGGSVDSGHLVDFVSAGGSLFIAANKNFSGSVRDVSAKLGVDFLEQGEVLHDYVSFDKNRGPQYALSSSVYQSSVLTGTPEHPILFHGGALTVSTDSALTMRSFVPSATAIFTSQGKPILGPQLSLAASTQSRQNSRFSVVASLDMLSDEYFNCKVQNALTEEQSPTGNRVFAQTLLRWTLKLKGVLKHETPVHHRTGDSAPPLMNTYTVKDDITVSVRVLEREGKGWVPHVTDTLVSEYVMLDPYIRQAMSYQGNGWYALPFKAPDAYGVFKWVVDYKKPGYTFMHFEEVMPLRPPRHDEYPRFIIQAYPYYCTLILLSIGFFVTLIRLLRSPESR